MSGIDIDFFTLKRLTDKAFKFDNSDRDNLKQKVLELINSEDPINNIVNYIEQDITARKIMFAASTADPKSALKPAGRLIRRISEEDAPQPLVQLSNEISQEEMDRRLRLAKEAHQRMILMGNIDIEDDDDDDDDDENSDEDEIEQALKAQILNSISLGAEEENESDDSDDPKNDDS